MMLLLTIVAAVVALAVTLSTSIQLLYLESLRIRARELPSLEFFKETLEASIGMETERGALSFSLVKHLGLTLLGCLLLAIALESAPGWEALAGAALLAVGVTLVCAYIVPQLVYRKTSGHGLLPLVPVFRMLALTVRPVLWGLEFFQSLFELGGRPATGGEPRPEEHIEALISAGE